MKTKRVNLANIQGKLSRTEMKVIMAGGRCTSQCFTSNGAKLSCIAGFAGCFTDSNCSNASTCTEPPPSEP